MVEGITVRFITLKVTKILMTRSQRIFQISEWKQVGICYAITTNVLHIHTTDAAKWCFAFCIMPCIALHGWIQAMHAIGRIWPFLWKAFWGKRGVPFVMNYQVIFYFVLYVAIYLKMFDIKYIIGKPGNSFYYNHAYYSHVNTYYNKIDYLSPSSRGRGMKRFSMASWTLFRNIIRGKRFKSFFHFFLQKIHFLFLIIFFCC